MKKKFELWNSYTTLGKIFIVSMSIVGLIILASLIIILIILMK